MALNRLENNKMIYIIQINVTINKNQATDCANENSTHQEARVSSGDKGKKQVSWFSHLGPVINLVVAILSNLF